MNCEIHWPPIRTALEILKRSASDPNTVLTTADLMDRQIRHMVQLVDDLLDVSRITQGKIELRKEFVSLATVIHHATETCMPALQAAGHRLSIQLPDEQIQLHVDLVRMSQVFSNLISNSCKYTEKNGEIVVSAERCQNK